MPLLDFAIQHWVPHLLFGLCPQLRGAAARQTTAGDLIETCGVSRDFGRSFTSEDRDDFIVSPSNMIPCRIISQPCNRDNKPQHRFCKQVPDRAQTRNAC